MAITLQTELSDEDLLARWKDFLRTQRSRIEAAAMEYPIRRSVDVPFLELDRHNKALAETTLRKPLRSLTFAERALDEVDLPTLTEKPKLKVRIGGLFEADRVEVRHLRSEHVGRLLAIEGLVKKATDVRPKVADALFQCNRCGTLFKVPQEEFLVFKTPIECPEVQGGCGRGGGEQAFKLLAEGSRFVDHQFIELQETPEGLRGGEQPRRLNVYVEDDLVGRVAPGDRVAVTGILGMSQQKKSGQVTRIFDLHVAGVSVEMQQQEYEEVKISPEDEAAIKTLAGDPEVYRKMVASIAPTIYGMELEKEALVLQLLGGVAKHLPDGSRLRGDIHVLLVGDPGVAKSQLLRYAARLAPRGIYTSGKGTSAAGLTAAAVRDELGEGRWTLEAGALVLADKGIACVDEIDKMEKEDRSAMHEAMEQQTISVAKAGITAQLQSRCAILGAANPKFGRFEEFTPISEQIDMPPPLLSRFDLIFSMTDKPDAEKDERLATHILKVHRAGEIREYVRANPDGLYTHADEEQAMVVVEPVVKPEFLRKFVAYAKRHCFPVITERAMAYLKDYYVGLRRQAGPEGRGPVPLTARQLESYVRLAEASARIRLADEVAEEDAERALKIVETYLRRVAGEDGRMDIDRVTSGIGHSQRERIQLVIHAVQELSAGREEGAAAESIVERLRNEVPEDKVRDILARLKQEGRIYEPRRGSYKVTSAW
ncbi:MAG: minichromosome maintenance protein MCM [Methanobacteriota archaeon]